jgi:hypothetical protein
MCELQSFLSSVCECLERQELVGIGAVMRCYVLLASMILFE